MLETCHRSRRRPIPCSLLPNALAVFECKIAHTYVGGDHVIFVGEVLHADCDPEGKPLGFFRGGYTQIG